MSRLPGTVGRRRNSGTASLFLEVGLVGRSNEKDRATKLRIGDHKQNRKSTWIVDSSTGSRGSAGATLSSEPSAAEARHARRKLQYINLNCILNTQMIVHRAWTPRGGRRRQRAGRAERTKNGQSSRADGVSMGPSALDRKNGAVQSSVRSCHISRGRRRVPRQWQCRQNSGSPVHRTPLCGGWDCPRSPVSPTCRGLLG